MGEQVWEVPQDQFVAAWNGSGDLTEAVAKMKVIAGANILRWAALARAQALRKEGVELRAFPVGVVSVA